MKRVLRGGMRGWSCKFGSLSYSLLRGRGAEGPRHAPGQGNNDRVRDRCRSFPHWKYAGTIGIAAPMHDIAYIRANPEAFDAAMTRRGADPVADRIVALDAKKREAQTRVQEA